MDMTKERTEAVLGVLLAMQRHCWEQGEAEHALTELGETETVIRMARETINRRLPDGRVGIMSEADERTVTDPCSCGQALRLAWEQTGDPRFQAAHEKLLHWTLHEAPRSEKGILYHLTDSPEFWADSMYMLPPFLADAGEYEEAVKQYNGYWDALFDPAAGLLHTFWHDGTGTFLRDGIHRGIANGYAVIAVCRMLPLLPEAMTEEKKELAEKARRIIDGMLKHERDGVFYDALDKPEGSFVAMNAAQMLAYGIYRGIQQGWLVRDGYLEHADRLRGAMVSRVDTYGFVNDVCGAPTFRVPGNAPNGQSFYLLMQCAAQDFVGKEDII
ncbi:MAG: glycoside hydrolase family 88 protein [Oscillospiraceae bacterium]|nr:glycoside hydrolase family 88 protein [Oscillospiraceae bacterium]